MSVARLIGWLVAALLGAGASILINQQFLSNTAPDDQEQGKPSEIEENVPVQEEPPPALTHADDARRVVIAGLNALGLSSQAIRQGIYPLRGAGRSPSDVMPLISFQCPMEHGCDALMAALERRLAVSGMALAKPSVPDRNGRPMYRAVFQEGRPALALRAYPPGGRVAIVVEGLGKNPAMLDILYELDPDVTFAVLASAPDASEIAGQLSSLGREFIAQIPMGIRNGQGESAQPALSTSMSRGEIAERAQAFIDTVQGAAGVNGHQNAAFASSSNHMTPVFEVLAQNGRYFFDQKPSEASVSTAIAKALSVRVASPTHRIDTTRSIDAQLQAARVTLVLEGQVVVVVQPKREVIESLKPWLAELRKRKFNVMRLSEIVL